MTFDRFHFGVLLRLGVILVLLALLAWVLTTTRYYALTAVLATLTGLLIWRLLAFVDRTNRELARFLGAITHADFTPKFSDDAGSESFAELAASLERVMDGFRALRSGREEQALYLQAVVHHIGTPIMAFREDGTVTLFNNAARRLFGRGELNNIFDFHDFGDDFPGILAGLGPGGRKLVKIEQAGQSQHLTLSANDLSLRDGRQKLVSLHNIQSELDTKELDAWRNLIQVLSHEIMNSITPIASLAETSSEILAETSDSLEESSPAVKHLKDVREAVETIAKRSEGLLRFVANYRRLSRVPTPDLAPIRVADLFLRVDTLMAEEMVRRAISLETDVVPSSLQITADSDLMEQTLINLLRNAADAVEGRDGAVILLAAALDPSGAVVLRVEDNGVGLDADIRDKIFVPFFTTKRGGSGVGLSLAREIARAHGGSITASARPGGGTIFAIRI